MVAHAIEEVLRVAAHEERTASLGADPEPPSHARCHGLPLAGALPPSKWQSLNEPRQAHPEGSVALHRRHRRQRYGSEMKKRRGRRKGIKDAASLGAPLYEPDGVL